MAEAEYEGQKAISAVIPDNAVRPIAWGYLSFSSDSGYNSDIFEETYPPSRDSPISVVPGQRRTWYLAPFLNLNQNKTPNPSDLIPVLKKLHRDPKSVSPNGMFGFHVDGLFLGPAPMVCNSANWTASWEEFYLREFGASLDYAQQHLPTGHDAELAALGEEFMAKVIPRLLRPLQTGGRSIKPVLCHGDLWDGNVQVREDTGDAVLFDPCPYYGHGEMDLQCMRNRRYQLARPDETTTDRGETLVQMYEREVGASEPKGDFDDRNAMYAV